MKPLRLLLLSLASLLFSFLLLASVAVALLLNNPAASHLLMGVATELTQGALQARAIRGPLAGPLEIEGLVYEDRHVRVEVAHAFLDWSLPALLAGQIRVRELRTGDAVLTLKPVPPDPDAGPALTRLPLALVVKNAELTSFSLITAPQAAPVRFENIRLAADWTGDDVSLDRLALHFAPIGDLQAQGRLQMQGRALAVETLEVTGLGQLQAEGSIGYDNHFELRVNWEDLRWPQAGEPQFLSSEGDLDAKGSWQDYAYTLNAAVHTPWNVESEVRAGDEAEEAQDEAQVQAQGRGHLDGVEFSALRLQTLEGELRARGALHWLPALSLEARGDFSGLNPAALNAQWPGHLNGRFDAQLQKLAPLTGRVELALQDSQLRGHPLQLQARVQNRGSVLDLQQFDLRAAASRLKLSGQLQPQFQLAGELQSPDLGELWPGLSGKAEARLQLRGSPRQPEVLAQARLHEVAYESLSVAQATLQVDFGAQKESSFDLNLVDLRAGLHVERVSLSGRGTPARNRFRLETVADVGRIDLEFAGALDLAQRLWQGRVESGRGEPLQLPPWTLQEPAALTLAVDRFSLSPLCWTSSTSRACLQFHQDAVESRLGFRVEGLVLAYFEPLMPPGWKVSGDISGTGLLMRREGHLRADLDLDTSAGEVTIGSRPVLKFAPGSWLAQETPKGFVSRLALPLDDGGIYWDALLSPAPDWEQRRWSGELRADLDSLQALRLFSPELESVDGRLDGRFRISGSAGAPRLDGALQLRDGRLRLATPGVELTEVSADLRAEASSGLLDFTAAAQSGGGRLNLKGSADADDLASSVRLQVEGNDFQVAGTTQARVWVSPRLEFRLNKNRADLNGEVAVPRADITPTTFDQGVVPSGDQVIVGADGEGSSSGLVKIYTSVRLTLGDDVHFSGFGLSTQLAGGLQAFDEPGRPTTARGEVRLLGGRYKAYGQDLSIQTGRLIFTGGPITAPAIDIRAERDVGDEVTVGLNIRGLLSAPEFSLFSTPTMPQDQQLAWLVLGRPLQESGTGSGSDRNALSGAALSLGLSGGNFFAQKLRQGLRLDEISVGSRPGETSDQAQLTFGKYLSPKIFVSYGIGLFQPGQAFRLLYDIGYGFKLSTESGVESGGDLVYTIEK